MHGFFAGGPDLPVLLGLGAAALVAGFVDAIAGGGGLITLPALLLAGFSPAAAVATNKVQGVFSTGSSTYAFVRAGLVDGRSVWPMALMAAIGALGGAAILRWMPTEVLAAAMPVLLIAMALYFALSGQMRDADAQRRIPHAAYTLGLAPLIGFYDGVFGPGAGSFYMLGFVTLLGFGLRRAAGHTKCLNFASNAASLLFFIASGAVAWKAGLVMAAGSFTGAQIGARTAIRHGARIIRPLLVLVCAATALKLLADPANPLHLAVMTLIGR